MKKVVLILLSVTLLLVSCAKQTTVTTEQTDSYTENLTEPTTTESKPVTVVTEPTDEVAEPSSMAAEPSEMPTEPSTDPTPYPDLKEYDSIEEVFADYELKYGTLTGPESYDKIAQNACDNYSGEKKQYFALILTDVPNAGMLISVGIDQLLQGYNEVLACIEQIYAFGHLVTVSEWDNSLFVIGNILESTDIKTNDTMLVCSSFRGSHNIIITQDDVASFSPNNGENFSVANYAEGIKYYLVNERFSEIHDTAMFIDAYQAPDEFRDEKGVIRIENGKAILVPEKTRTVQQWFEEDFPGNKHGYESVEDYVAFYKEFFTSGGTYEEWLEMDN